METVDVATISDTLQELARDLDIAAVKIGMLGSAKVVKAVAEFLAGRRLPNVVLDPIFKASSGADMVDLAGSKLIAERLLPLATVVTPNLDEASVLSGLPVSNPDEMKAAARKLHQMGAPNVVVTGGHLDKAIDLLSFTNAQGSVEQELFKAERRRSKSTHGTGCAFSSAMACHLALGRGMPEAVLLAKAYVTAAIANAQPLGRGIGPVHHLYRMHEAPRRSVTPDPEPVH